MPIYDYKCSNCGQEHEIIQKFSDKPKTLCSKCGEESLTKLISAPSFRLKGGGWYETDFKTGSKKNIVDSKDEKSKQPKEQTKTTDKSKSKSSDKKT